MKVFIVLSLMAVAINARVVISENERLIKKQFSKECAAETKVDPAVIEKFELGEFVDDAKLKEQTLCVFKRYGTMNDAGEFQLDELKKKFMKKVDDEKKVDEILKKCVIKKDTPQDSAFEASKCFYTVISKLLWNQEKELKAKYSKECTTETKVSEELVKELDSGKESSEASIRDYAYCVAKKYGIYNDAGEFQAAALKNQLFNVIYSEKKVDEILAKCNIKKDKPTESAYYSALCYCKTIPKKAEA